MLVMTSTPQLRSCARASKLVTPPCGASSASLSEPWPVHKDLLSAFNRVRRERDGYSARCPAHDDQRASLSISVGEGGRWLLYCHAKCPLPAILAAAHLELADLFPSTTESHDGRRQIEATYAYRAEDRQVLYEAVRFSNPKGFAQRTPDGAGGWVWKLNGVRRVLYRLPDLHGRKTVFNVEGEKDAEKLWSLELPATTNAGGAGKWRDDYAVQLKSAGVQQVIVLPDNDPPGETHGRCVARSCADAGLAVKLIPLPDLPAKGDVSDFLARHSKDELLAIVRDAPAFNPQRSVTVPPPLELTSLADLLQEPDDLVEWIVEDRIPAGGAVVLLVGAPKAGKSTAVRELALAVAQPGGNWLGWKTTYGVVWLLLFQDKRSEVKKHLRQMGATGNEPLHLLVESATADLLPRLHARAEKERPSLIVVDMLAGLLNVKDLNDYAQVTSRFEPLLKLSRATGATLLLLHHGSAHAAREGLDAVLGSTALSGSVDNILVLRRLDQQRVLSSIQRIGPDLAPTVIVLNPETGRLEQAGTKRQHDDRELGARILEAIRAETNPVSEAWIQDRVEGRNADKVRVLRRLLGMRQVQRVGAGGRKDPFRYSLESSCSHESGSTSNGANGREHQSRPANIELFDDSAVLVPMFPISTPEQENKNSEDVLRTAERSSSHHDSCSQVPDRFENSSFQTQRPSLTTTKHSAGSCSHEDDFERF